MFNKNDAFINPGILKEQKDFFERVEGVLNQQADTTSLLLKFLEDKEKERKEAKETHEIVTIGNDFKFDAQGLTYNALVVRSKDNATVLKVEYKTIIFEVVLAQGINRLNLKSDMVLSVENPISVNIIRSNKEI